MSPSARRTGAVSDAYAAMERALTLRDAAHASTREQLEAALSDVIAELKIVRDRGGTANAEGVANAERLVQSWYRTGLLIGNPPPEGLTEVPLPAHVMQQGDAVAGAIDRVVEDASAYGFEFRSQAEANVAALRSNLTKLAIVAGVVGILVLAGIAYSFGSAIRNAMAISERIAHGNLSHEIRTTRRDELGRLLVSLKQMQEAFKRQSESQRSAAAIKDRDHANDVARRERVEQQIAGFRSSISDMLKQADEVTGQLNRTAMTLSQIATNADNQAKEAVGSAEETSGNVANVAAGARSEERRVG